MNELINTLLNIRTLRSACKEVSTADLQQALEKLTLVVNERVEKEQQEQAENAERIAKLEEIRALLIQDGIDLEEFVQATSESKKPKSKRAPRPAKYKFVDSEGNEKTWTGQGRMPLALQKKIDSGHSLEEFEI